MALYARAFHDTENIDDSQKIFEAIRKSDEFYMEHLDLYGHLLFLRSDEMRLSKLAIDLLHVDSNRPEGWVTAALYNDLKGDSDKVLPLIDKVPQSNALQKSAPDLLLCSTDS